MTLSSEPLTHLNFLFRSVGCLHSSLGGLEYKNLEKWFRNWLLNTISIGMDRVFVGAGIGSNSPPTPINSPLPPVLTSGLLLLTRFWSEAKLKPSFCVLHLIVHGNGRNVHSCRSKN